jgi:hypothetical protein
MKTKISIVLILFCIVVCVTPSVKAETAASIRYISVEQITTEPDYPSNFNTPVACTHFAYTFALWKVNAWADRCYYVAYTDKGGVVAKWSVGFSVTGGLQGIYLDQSSGLLQVETVMAEFPYTKTNLTNALDGTQTYSFYIMHFYFTANIFKGDVVTVAADYMREPITPYTLTSNALTVQHNVTAGTGDSATYKIIKTNPSDFKFHEVKTK